MTIREQLEQKYKTPTLTTEKSGSVREQLKQKYAKPVLPVANTQNNLSEMANNNEKTVEPVKKSSLLDKVKAVGKKVLPMVSNAVAPGIGSVLNTELGQKVATGVAKQGFENIKSMEKPFLQPFAMVTNKNIPATPISPAVSANPSTGELAEEALNLGLTAFGLKSGKEVAKAVANKVLPSASKKALSLTNKELQSVDKSKLKYLGTKGLDMIKTEGGILKEKTFIKPKQVLALEDEFSHLLTSNKPEKNIQNVLNEMSTLQKSSKSVFNEVNRTVNKKQVSNGIKKAISNMSDTAYESMPRENQIAYADKRVNDFLSYVKDGTLKGLDDGLEAYRKANAKGDATLNKTTDVMYQAVKKYIIDNLPEEKAAAYKLANQKQAKLFDVAEILKGKIKATTGESTLKKVKPFIPWAAAAGATGVYNAIKK